MTVGAANKQGKIPSGKQSDQRLEKDLTARRVAMVGWLSIPNLRSRYLLPTTPISKPGDVDILDANLIDQRPAKNSWHDV